MVRASQRPDSSQDWPPGSTRPLPSEISVGRPTKVSLRIADRLHHWHRLGRVKSVVLRVRFGNLISDYDQIEVEWNGRLLPESILQKSEMTYRPTGNVSTGHAIGPYGYAFDYHLGSEHFPNRAATGYRSSS